MYLRDEAAADAAGAVLDLLEDHPERQRDLRADETLAVVARGGGGGADDELLIAAPREPGPRLMIAGDPSRLESSGSARAREQRDAHRHDRRRDAHDTTAAVHMPFADLVPWKLP